MTDRFADSSRVYQGAVRGDLRDLVDRLHALVIGIEPDLTLVIDLDPAEALARAEAREAPAASTSRTAPVIPAEDRFESLGLDFQRRLRDGFRALAAEYPDRVRLIDGSGTTGEIAARISEVVAAFRPAAADDGRAESRAGAPRHGAATAPHLSNPAASRDSSPSGQDAPPTPKPR